METIGLSKMWSFFDSHPNAKDVTCTTVRKAAGHRVSSFLELATNVAELQFRNRNHVLLFRGQDRDYRNKDGNTSLKPTLFRPPKGMSTNPGQDTLVSRFVTLKAAESELATLYSGAGLLGRVRLNRYQILRWSILQHYDVCPTPLLDLTHSLRIAASFASLTAEHDAFVFVLGVPNLSGAITASAEAGLQVVRLASACPPSAVRPHIQEGYLLGEYPEMADYDQKLHYKHYEIDFGRRLVAKFRFDPRNFWKRDTFPKIRKDALYPPPDKDPLYKLAIEVRQTVEGQDV
ncbi:MAG: hypothetical protein BVN28_06700 [Nitrospira sp. ST-bin4]|nr:MAG: hypothetical protein BVN28_06700 [Nitrospira sp. ST-bin4]